MTVECECLNLNCPHRNFYPFMADCDNCNFNKRVQSCIDVKDLKRILRDIAKAKRGCKK